MPSSRRGNQARGRRGDFGGVWIHGRRGKGNYFTVKEFWDGSFEVYLCHQADIIVILHVDPVEP